jgi:hypothetical protein
LIATSNPRLEEENKVQAKSTAQRLGQLGILFTREFLTGILQVELNRRPHRRTNLLCGLLFYTEID